MTPVGGDINKPMQVNATIQNKKPLDSKALVRLFQGHPQSPTAKLLGRTTDGAARQWRSGCELDSGAAGRRHQSVRFG